MAVSQFPEQNDTFPLMQDIPASQNDAKKRYKELKDKSNRTEAENTELNSLAVLLKNSRINADIINLLFSAMTKMQTFIRDNIFGFFQTKQDETTTFVNGKKTEMTSYVDAKKLEVDTAKDNALIAIEQKKNNVIEYMDSTTAGQLRNDIGIMGELTTTDKLSLVNAINEVNAKEVDLTPIENSISSLAGEGRTTETVKGNADAIAAHQADNTTAHGIDGILSKLNNLNANDSEVRKELLDLKLKLDEKDVIDFISSKSGIGFYDLFTNNDYVDTANTTATIANTNVTFQGSKVLKMKPQNFDNFSKLELAVYDKNREKIAADESSTNSITIKSTIGIGSMTAGDELFYKGVTYTVQSVAEA